MSEKEDTPLLASDETYDKGLPHAVAAALTNLFDSERFVLMTHLASHAAPVPCVTEPGETVNLTVGDLLGAGVTVRLAYRNGSFQRYYQNKELAEVDDMLKNLTGTDPDPEAN